MEVLLSILAAVVLVSLVSFVGLALLVRSKILDMIMFTLASFAAGSLLAASFFELLPEALQAGADVSGTLMYTLFGIVSFFFLERALHWHHSHSRSEVHAFTYLNLIGDAIHNFVDGVAIAASFILSPAVGFSATVAIIMHEIPQELSDFGVLIYGGWKPKKALFYNALSGVTAVAGGLLAYGYLVAAQAAIASLVAFSAGALLYIATADLFPEINKERSWKKIVIQMFAFLIGILLIWMVGILVPE